MAAWNMQLGFPTRFNGSSSGRSQPAADVCSGGFNVLRPSACDAAMAESASNEGLACQTLTGDLKLRLNIRTWLHPQVEVALLLLAHQAKPALASVLTAQDSFSSAAESLRG
jgi:hypothetical protein